MMVIISRAGIRALTSEYAAPNTAPSSDSRRSHLSIQCPNPIVNITSAAMMDRCILTPGQAQVEALPLHAEAQKVVRDGGYQGQQEHAQHPALQEAQHRQREYIESGILAEYRLHLAEREPHWRSAGISPTALP